MDFREGGGIRTCISWMIPVFQNLVDRVLMLCLLPYCRGLGYTRLYPVQSQLHGKTPCPPGPVPGAESSRPDGQMTLGFGDANGVHTSPRLCPYPTMQVATCPGWLVCVDSWQGRMWSISYAPYSLPAKAGGNLQWRVYAETWKMPGVQGERVEVEKAGGYCTGNKMQCP